MPGPTLGSLKIELEQFGDANDRTHAGRSQRMLNITRNKRTNLSGNADP